MITVLVVSDFDKVGDAAGLPFKLIVSHTLRGCDCAGHTSFESVSERHFVTI
jgi:hypothetical protein